MTFRQVQYLIVAVKAKGFSPLSFCGYRLRRVIKFAKLAPIERTKSPI